MGDLKPNKKLINNKFNGYKLASSVLQINSMSLISGVNEPLRSMNQYSYVTTRCHQMHNHLYIDQWNSMVYFIDAEYRVNTLLSIEDGQPSSLYHTFTIPQRERSFDVFSCTMVFPCETLVVLCDGGGSIYLVHTGHRKKADFQNWKCGGKVLHDFDSPTYVFHANIEVDILHIITVTLQQIKDNTTMSVIFNWFQVKLNFDNPEESLMKGMKTFMGKDLPNALWLSEDYAHLLVASTNPVHLVDQHFVPIELHKSSNGDTCDEVRLYNWQQSKELISISFILWVTENEIYCDIKHNMITLTLKNGKRLLAGSLDKEVIQDACRWYIEKNRLEVVLVKKVPGEFWQSVVPDDTHGNHIIEGEEEERIRQIGEGLSHLTSENETLHEEERHAFNLAQLEECDKNEEEIKLYSIDVFTGKMQTVKNLSGYRWLFATKSNNNSAPLICLRHNVDGIVWQANNSQWQHKATFDAFGFVCASKSESKFILCSPNFKYAFITDCTSHVYIYESDKANPHQHNQYIAGLQDCNKILGCQSTNNSLYILSDKHINIVNLPHIEDIS